MSGRFAQAELNWKAVENYPDKICQFGDQMSCESWCYENLDILWWPPVGPVWCQSDMLGCSRINAIIISDYMLYKSVRWKDTHQHRIKNRGGQCKIMLVTHSPLRLVLQSADAARAWPLHLIMILLWEKFSRTLKTELFSCLFVAYLANALLYCDWKWFAFLQQAVKLHSQLMNGQSSFAHVCPTLWTNPPLSSGHTAHSTSSLW